MKHGLIPTLLVSLVAGCSASTETPPPGQGVSAPANQAPVGLRPGQDSAVSIHTLPYARCVLGDKGLTIFSNGDGVATLHLTPTAEATNADLSFSCSDESGVTHQETLPVYVDQAAVAPAAPLLKAIGTRPALDPATTMTNQELVAHGYPPRPEASDGESLKRWTEVVSRSFTVVDARLVRDPHLHGPAQITHPNTSSIWAGYVSTTPNPYTQIYGEWTVPTVHSRAGFIYLDYSSLWVGMTGIANLVQAGTEMDTQTIFGVQASSYYAWTEYWPDGTNSISGLSVNPGDVIESSVWVGDADGSIDASGAFGWFVVTNLTTGVTSGLISTATPAGTFYNGNSAAWVVERPSMGSSPTDLAEFGYARMFNPMALDSAYTLHTWRSDSSTLLYMMNGSDLLAWAGPGSGLDIWFFWDNYN